MAGKIGILALQGGFAAHGSVLDRLKVSWQFIREPNQLDIIDALIIPGGESTTLLKFIQPFISKLNKFNFNKKPIFTTCAGTILLAKNVINPDQKSLGLLDITVERNAYGRQVDSFTSSSIKYSEMVFIRAPKIIKTGPNVEILATYKKDAVLIKENNILAATFHPELSQNISPNISQNILSNKYPTHSLFLEFLSSKI